MNICISGDFCTEEAVESTKFPGEEWFCESHQAKLDSVREELESGTFNSRNDDDLIDRYCVSPGCPNRPLYGGEYCLECNGSD